MDQEVATFSLQYSCLENFMDGRAWNSVTLLQASVLSSVSLLSSISLYVCTIFVHPFLSWIFGLFSLSCIGEGNGNPRQCSCLENPRNRGAWWAAVYVVAQSRTWLKWISSNSSRILLMFRASGIQRSKTNKESGDHEFLLKLRSQAKYRTIEIMSFLPWHWS